MILGDAQRAAVNRTTLDDLFRRATMRRPEALALADPPNSAAITGCRPRPLTHAEADGAISALAARLHALGLPTDSVVAVQPANTVDSVIALLPHRCRCSGALLRCSAKAIITAARIGTSAPAENAIAGGVRSIRHPSPLRLRARSARRCAAARRLREGWHCVPGLDAAGQCRRTCSDAQLGQRLAGSMPAGVNALIVGALQQRHPS